MNKRGCCKIGWYCPYTFPPIAKIKNIETVQIGWDQGINSFFGNVKLCSKMTSLLGILERKELNGLVMPECCNVSYSIGEFIKREYRDLSLYSINLPRKVDDYFLKALWEQWNTLYDRLGGSEQAENGGTGTNPFKWNTKVEEAIPKSGDFSFTRLKRDCCSLSKDIEINGKDFKKIVYELLETVNCPRMLFDNKGEIRGLYNFYSIPMPDKQCILQRYQSCLSETDIKKENGDE